jgi:predicted RNase H-like HicB family nuclease
MRTTPKGRSYQIDLIPDEDGGYTVVVPALPGCISYGESVVDATRNAREAIELHLANLAAHKQPIPQGHEMAPVLSTLVRVNHSNGR